MAPSTGKMWKVSESQQLQGFCHFSVTQRVLGRDCRDAGAGGTEEMEANCSRSEALMKRAKREANDFKEIEVTGGFKMALYVWSNGVPSILCMDEGIVESCCLRGHCRGQFLLGTTPRDQVSAARSMLRLSRRKE